METHFIGKSVQRKEGREKVTWAAQFDDLTFPDMLHGITVRSSIARERIRAIHFGDDIPWDEFTIVRAKDIPGKNSIALIVYDQPCLADQIVNHAEEPILLLAHADKYLVEEARRSVQSATPQMFPIVDRRSLRELR